MSSRPTSDRPATILRRPASHPVLDRRLRPPPPSESSSGHRLTKLLLNVAFQSSPGPVHVVISPENTVADLVRAAVAAYVKEGRRPLLPSTDPEAFELHYSQYSLESLERTEKLINLGSRNFFLCFKPAKDCTNRQNMTIVPSL